MENTVHDDLPLIKPDIYDMRFHFHQTSLMFGRAPKITLWFEIVEPGHFGTTLPRYYNAQKLIGKPRKKGAFKAGRRSDLLLEYCTVFSDYKPMRLDRIPLSKYSEVIVKGRVSTVTKNYKQRDIPKTLQYSIISEILRVKKL